MVSAKQAIDRVNRRFGVHPGFRALHAKGVFCNATFTATEEAASLSRAEHFRGPQVDALVRFSNAMGDPDVPDYVPDARGMAVSFRLQGGAQTDIVSQTAPLFPVRTPDAFLELVEATPDDASRAWKLPWFLARHPEAVRTLPGNVKSIRPIESFATCNYYALHAFRLLDADGGSRWVRYKWVPEAGDVRISGREAKRRGADYLFEELPKRLAGGPARFTLQLTIAGEGDAVDDPNAGWPDKRRKVDAGTLEVTETIDDPEQSGIVVFDPVKVTDGIELSADDPIVHYRTAAYTESANRRAG